MGYKEPESSINEKYKWSFGNSTPTTTTRHIYRRIEGRRLQPARKMLLNLDHTARTGVFPEEDLYCPVCSKLLEKSEIEIRKHLNSQVHKQTVERTMTL